MLQETIKHTSRNITLTPYHGIQLSAQTHHSLKEGADTVCVHLLLCKRDLKKTRSPEDQLFILAEPNSSSDLFCQDGGGKKRTQKTFFPKQVSNLVDLFKLKETSELASFETLSFPA